MQLVRVENEMLEEHKLYFLDDSNNEVQLISIYDDCDECVIKDVKTEIFYRYPYYNDTHWVVYCKVPNPKEQKRLDIFLNKYLKTT